MQPESPDLAGKAHASLAPSSTEGIIQSNAMLINRAIMITDQLIRDCQIQLLKPVQEGRGQTGPSFLHPLQRPQWSAVKKAERHPIRQLDHTVRRAQGWICKPAKAKSRRKTLSMTEQDWNHGRLKPLWLGPSDMSASVARSSGFDTIEPTRLSSTSCEATSENGSHPYSYEIDGLQEIGSFSSVKEDSCSEGQIEHGISALSPAPSLRRASAMDLPSERPRGHKRTRSRIPVPVAR